MALAGAHAEQSARERVCKADATVAVQAGVSFRLVNAEDHDREYRDGNAADY